MESGEQQKSSITRLVIVIILLVLTLPITYMLFARVILPLVWDEQQFNETTIQPDSK
jgi:hypothetical protein